MDENFNEEKILRILFPECNILDDFSASDDFINKRTQSFQYFDWCLNNLHNFKNDKMMLEAIDMINMTLKSKGRKVSMKYYTKLSEEYFRDLLNDQNYSQFLKQIITGQVALIEILYPKIWPDFYGENGLFSFDKNIIFRFIIELSHSFEQKIYFGYFKNNDNIVTEYQRAGIHESLFSFLEGMLNENEYLDLILECLSGISKWVNFNFFSQHETILKFIKSQLDSNSDYQRYFNKVFLKKIDVY